MTLICSTSWLFTLCQYILCCCTRDIGSYHIFSSLDFVVLLSVCIANISYQLLLGISFRVSHHIDIEFPHVSVSPLDLFE